jgi:hypothetical protein
MANKAAIAQVVDFAREHRLVEEAVLHAQAGAIDERDCGQ